MTILVYATSSDYQSWTGNSTLPSNITLLLRTASMLVRDATKCAYYEVDASGYPTNADDVAAMRDATCSQAAALEAASVDPLAAGTDPEVAASSIGSASVTYAGVETAAQARFRLGRRLCLEAERILSQAGLAGQPPEIHRG